MTYLKKHSRTLTTLAAAVLIALPFVLRPYVVTGGSMETAYHEGQLVLIERVTPSIYIWRGEVLVIRNPHDKAVTEIKRVAGLPGEDITLGEGSVTAAKNGAAHTYGPPVGLPATEFFHMQLGPADYMVLGDNRSKSTDSRAYGAVQKSDVIGHVILAL